MAAKRVVFICQAVDSSDPSIPHIPKWISALCIQKDIGTVHVVTLRAAETLPSPVVQIHVIRSRSRFLRFIEFYRITLKLVYAKQADCFFICQGGAYPLLLLPIRFLCRIPVYQWKAHSFIGLMMKFYARFCIDHVFTPTASSFRYAKPKITITGHGIDTDLFNYVAAPSGSGLVAVGRVSPIKHIDAMIKALASYRNEFGEELTLSVYGPHNDFAYLTYLRSLCQDLKLEEFVKFHGPVKHAELPGILRKHKLMLFFCASALGKAALEAFACGIPVVSTNECVSEVLSEDLKQALMVPRNDPVAQARAIHRLVTMDAESYRVLVRSLAKLVRDSHSVEHLFSTIAPHITT